MRHLAVLLSFTVIACAQPETPPDTSDFLARGQEIASTTQRTMAGQLLAALNSGGVEEAVAYCSVNAFPIADSLSREFGATIRRVTMKPRNPDNAADAREHQILDELQRLIDDGSVVKPQVHRLADGTTVFHAPIVTASLCLNCHGEADDMAPADLALIQSLYPEDQAMGYMEGDLRGMWSIRFDK